VTWVYKKTPAPIYKKFATYKIQGVSKLIHLSSLHYGIMSWHERKEGYQTKRVEIEKLPEENKYLNVKMRESRTEVGYSFVIPPISPDVAL
jgi:hypothetical protein